MPSQKGWGKGHPLKLTALSILDSQEFWPRISKASGSSPLPGGGQRVGSVLKGRRSSLPNVGGGERTNTHVGGSSA